MKVAGLVAAGLGILAAPVAFAAVHVFVGTPEISSTENQASGNYAVSANANVANNNIDFSSNQVVVSTDNTLESLDPPPMHLDINSFGDDVRTVQKDLIQMKYLTGTADGHFGTQTRSAVLDFQKAHKLVADGVVGPTTFHAIQTAAANHEVKNVTTAPTTINEPNP